MVLGGNEIRNIIEMDNKFFELIELFDACVLNFKSWKFVDFSDDISSD